MTNQSHNHQLQRMTYMAYLVRLWRESPAGTWRASAQSVQTGETIRFGSQQALFAFLEGEIHTTEEPSDDEEP